MEFLLDEEPANFKRASAPAPARDDRDELPPPPRATFVKEKVKRAARDWSGPDLGIKVVGWYMGINTGVFAFLWLLRLIFGTLPPVLVIGWLGIVCLCWFGLGAWGNIWLLVIAFRENPRCGTMFILHGVCSAMAGATRSGFGVACALLSVLLGLYCLYYVATRWSETKGPLALMLGPAALTVLFFLLTPALTGARSIQELNAVNRPMAAQPVVNQPMAVQPLRAKSADLGMTAQAEPMIRQNIQAIRQLTSELSRVQDEASARQSADAITSAAATLRDAETRGQAMTVGRAEMIALKHSVGKDMCAALTALKQEYMRIQLIPGLRSSSNDERIANIEKSIKYWSIGAGEENAPTLADGFPSAPSVEVQPAFPAAGPNPGPGARPGRQPRNPLAGRGPQRGNPFAGRARQQRNPFAGQSPQSVALGNSPRPDSEPDPDIPAGADPVTRSLIELKSPNIGKKKQAIQRLERTTPDQQLGGVVAALLPILDDDDGFLVSDTIKALAVWHSPEVVPAFIEHTKDNRFNVRHEAIKALGKIKDVRAVEPLIDRFSEDGFQAEAALKEMGPIAEPALIARLKDRSADVRRKACDILKEIGGTDTLKAMDALPKDPDFGTQVAAAAAYKQIVSRVGPVSSSSRAGKTAAPTRGRR